MKKRQPYSKKDALPADEIVTRYRAGESLAQIARTYGSSANTVKRILEQQGVQRRPAHHAVTSAPGRGPRGLAESLPAEEIITQYREGAALLDLAEQYGVSVGTIRRVMDTRGEERRSPEPETGVARAISAETEAEIIRRSRRGESLRGIANALGISRGAVSKAFERNQVQASSHRLDLPMGEIARRRAAGEPVQALATEYGVSRATLHRRLKEASTEGSTREH